jgi:hypothetical protein
MPITCYPFYLATLQLNIIVIMNLGKKKMLKSKIILDSKKDSEQ